MTDQEHKYVIYNFVKFGIKMHSAVIRQEAMFVIKAPQEQHCSVCLSSHLLVQYRVRDTALQFTGCSL